ncbi:MAG: thioredoxin domain-containing protein [Gammaproteobacteria bacterium]
MSRFLLTAMLLLNSVMLPAAGQTGGWRLAGESSPYLQLHAANPVAWHPWGEAALQQARRENKPLFISIGYFTCHWCHVMARESFSNPSIARLLNEHFIAIKIDREQRPDLDAAYMEYVQLTQGIGGWPLSVWALPGGEPFLGGTYYPPESSPGQTGFRELLQRLSELWGEDEATIRRTAQHAVELLAAQQRSVRPVKLSAAPLVLARQQYRELYDELQGGFGMAPKFPQPARLLFLLEDTEPSSREMAAHTLERMIAGGIHDHLGGGFHRYSTDFEWRLPHFEKMLYDQALIARACLVAWRETRRSLFADAARGILDFSLRELRHPQGGFYSALSADSPDAGAADAHMQEGAYYTWSWDQLTAALGEGALRDWAAARYGLARGGNALHDPLGEMQGRNVLIDLLDEGQLAEQFAVDLLTVKQRNAKVDGLLRAARLTRPPVPVDDKVVAAWNGYMITTLALAGRLLDEPRYLQAAEQAAAFVLQQLHDDKDGVLYRDWRDGTRGVAGFNEDYAGLAEALLSLYQVTGEQRWLQRARGLVERQLALFWDDTHGGFYNTPGDRAGWLREKRLADGASVSDNGVALHALLTLGRLTGRGEFTDRARQVAAWAMAQHADDPSSMPYTLRAWPQLLSVETISGKTDK